MPERHRKRLLYLTSEATLALNAQELTNADRADEMTEGMAAFSAEINTAVYAYDLKLRRAGG